MTGEVALGGVFLPTLVLLAGAAVILTALATRLVGAFGLYRFVAYRALVDLCLFVFILAALSLLVPLTGIPL